MSITKIKSGLPRGRPKTGRARPNRVQICLSDSSVPVLAAVLQRAQAIAEQQALRHRDKIAMARLLGELCELAAERHPELVEEIAARHGREIAERQKARETRSAA
jgi:hypothetical protein